MSKQAEYMSNTLYMAGNGKILGVYDNGDLIRVFGPPYSSPSILECRLLLASSIQRGIVSRESKVASWNLPLNENGKNIGCITDFAWSYGSCLVRRVVTSRQITMRLQPYNANKEQLHYEAFSQKNGENEILFKTKNGNPIYNDYPLPFPQFFKVIIKGAVTVNKIKEYTYDIQIDGCADIFIIGGPSYPECDQTSMAINEKTYEQLLADTRTWWAGVFESVTALDNIPNDMPRREELIYAIESTVVNIIVQQAEEGAVIAGEPFPLGYVRDQYGVCLGLLSLGLKKQARKILEFYINVFRHNGCILNAQGIGVKGMFHFAENDKTEITGYLLLQFFKYAQITGDFDIVHENIDFMYWLYLQQKSQIHNNMLPFNGDETYIAGGLLPRDVLNEGSAEATMLFILSSSLLIDYLQKKNLVHLYDVDEMIANRNQVEAKYKDNFVINGVYTLNNPKRLDGLEQPEYRYGVCMNLGYGDCDFFGWTKRCDTDVYLCPKCISNGKKLERKVKLYYMPSALLLPAYVDSPYPGKEIAVNFIQTLISKMNDVGYFYSDEEQKKNIGYDYGLLLCNMVLYNMDDKEVVYNKLLDLMDDVGTWAERYIDNKPAGVRFRSWESAINIDALIKYAENF